VLNQSMRDLILVVDDEPFVLNIVSDVLAHAGFAVLKAPAAAEALHIGRRHAGPIRLMISDVVMPGLSGPSLADAFAEIHPETEFMFMAGLTGTPEVCDRILSRGRAFLPKPFVPRTLLDKVREVLGASAGGPLVAA
jgi:two-component system cell cycle sensor histidine kinase/response regulator CckA